MGPVATQCAKIALKERFKALQVRQPVAAVPVDGATLEMDRSAAMPYLQDRTVNLEIFLNVKRVIFVKAKQPIKQHVKQEDTPVAMDLFHALIVHQVHMPHSMHPQNVMVAAMMHIKV